MASLIVRDLVKDFYFGGIPILQKKKVVRAIDGVSFTCPENRITCIVGQNGAGKTTLLKILACLILPDSGEITGLEGRVGLMSPNDRSLYWRLTGMENLQFFATLNNLRGASGQKKIDTLVDEFDLFDEIKKPVRFYSTGMKYKLLLLRALLGDPDVLLLDEPTSHIDPLAREQIHKIIRERLIEGRRVTVLLCTHDLGEAEKLSDRIILLDKGKIIVQGSFEELKKQINPRIIYRICFRKKCPIESYYKLGLTEITDKDSMYEFMLDDPEIIPAIVAESVRNNGEILWCMEYKEDLLDIIKRFTGKATES